MSFYNTLALTAGADLTNAVGRPLALQDDPLDPGGKQVAVLCTDANIADFIGVCTKGAAEGQLVRVVEAISGSQVNGIVTGAGSNVTARSLLTVNASSEFVNATTGNTVVARFDPTMDLNNTGGAYPNYGPGTTVVIDGTTRTVGLKLADRCALVAAP